MFHLLKQMAYRAFCAGAVVLIASYALLPVSAATANALSYRGGQSCPSGCHNAATSCSSSSSCSNYPATACFSGPGDNNNFHCGPDSGLCNALGCGGADVLCAG